MLFILFIESNFLVNFSINSIHFLAFVTFNVPFCFYSLKALSPVIEQKAGTTVVVMCYSIVGFECIVSHVTLESLSNISDVGAFTGTASISYHQNYNFI